MLFSLCTLLQAELIWAQYDHVYDSIYEPVQGFKGHARFSYHIGSEGKRLKQGEFTFERKKVDSSRSMKVVRTNWVGEYNEGMREGDWSFITISNELKLLDITKDFEVEFELYSVKEELKAQFMEDKPHGKWRLLEEVLKDGQPTNVLKSVRGNMKASRFNGNIEFTGLDADNREYSIEGEAENGLMLGDWYFNYYENDLEVEELREYNQGFLRSILKINLNTGDTISYLEIPISEELRDYLKSNSEDYKAAGIPLSLTFNDGYSRNSAYLQEQKKANEIVENSIKNLFKFDEDYFQNNGLPLGTNRLIYPLSATEKELLKQWPDILFRYRDQLTTLVETKEANFNYDNNQTLKLIDEWADRQTWLLAYIKPWNQILAHNELIYYNRRGPLHSYARELLTTDTLISSGKPTVIQYESKMASDSGFLSFITNNFTERAKVADSMLTEYREVLRKLDLAREILIQESQINLLKNYLDSIYETNRDQPKAFIQLSSEVKDNFLSASFKQRHEEFINYSGNKEEQKLLGDSIVFDLRQLKDAYFTMEDIFYTANEIDTLYTEYVFDAYTFNDRFPKRIKKKLYQAAAEDLFKEFLKMAANQDSPAKLRAILNRIVALQERLIFLVDKDTGKLERKLKEKMELEKKLELLKIE